ncbi:hypothetical protein [Niallia sp. FSL W8-0635]|uniref:hypothetical protein n=1 Tax=Niallia sp. FSL W8-0635 TaxID=2975337 RepID=UPI0030FA3AD4
MEKDIFCIGVSLKKGEMIIGTFSVSVSKYRLTENFKNQIIQVVAETKDELEQVLTH